MKRYIYILCAMASFLLWSCENEEMHTPTYKDAGQLEVSFVYNEALAKSITLTPASQTVEVEVKLNHDDVKWNVTSDQSWCIVDDDVIHEGSGSFELTVIPNETYNDREPAEVVFHAGEYEAKLRVTQIGNIFKMDQVFGLGMKNSGSVDISVKTSEGVVWTTKQPDWVTVAPPVVISTENGETEYKMTVQWSENNSESRLGTVELYRDGEDVSSAKYALWQFGDGKGYDFDTPDGSIRLVSKPSAEVPLEIKTPVNHIEALQYPEEWIQLEKVENDDNTTSWLLYFGQNPSDCNDYRETVVTYTTLGVSEARTLAPILQDFYPVGGLISAKGFALFSETFNAGEDVSNWVKDGVVNVLSSVDMSDLDRNWVPIGTEEHPFNLKFNGDSRIISGLTSSSPLFGVCDGAEIYDVIIDNTSKVTLTQDYNSAVYVAALAEKLTNSSSIKDCSSSAAITIDARPAGNGIKIYAGGLAGYVDASSTISGSRNEGLVRVTAKASAVNTDIYVGGIAAHVEGTVSECENTGDVTDESVAKYHYVGGITGNLSASGVLDQNVSSGLIKNVSTRKVDGVEVTAELFMGGVVGFSHGTLKNQTNSGTVEAWSDSKTITLGGVVGRVANGAIEKCTTISGTVSYNGPINTTDTPGKGRYVYIGGVMGVLAVEYELNYTGLTVSCDLNSIDIEDNKGQQCVGGVIGFLQKKLDLVSPSWAGNIKYTITGGNPGCNTCVGGIIGWSEVAGLSITGATTTGTIQMSTSLANNKYWYQGTLSIGGQVGKANNGLSISESTNNVTFGWTSASQTSNNGLVSTGGIVGRIDQGLAFISKCTNNGALANLHKNDNAWTAGKLSANRTGGIIGTYGGVADLSTLDESTSNITISECTNTADLQCYRGLAGGIAGCLYNAAVENCSFTGKVVGASSAWDCGMGGIAGAVEYSTVSNCRVLSSFSGVSVATAGGIVANLASASSISDSRYFGHISVGAAGRVASIVGLANEGCSVSGCLLGGSVLNENVTQTNFANYIVGNNSINTSDCNYWDGK